MKKAKILLAVLATLSVGALAFGAIGCDFGSTQSSSSSSSETQTTESGNYWHYVDGVVTKW